MPMPERTAGTAFADHDAHNRRANLAHRLQILGDNRRLTAFLGRDPRIRTGRVDERDDRQTILGRQCHLLQCLAITLRMGTPEVARLALGEVLPLLVADKHHLEVVEMGQPRDDRRIIAKRPVAMQLEKLLEDQIEIIASLRPLLVP